MTWSSVEWNEWSFSLMCDGKDWCVLLGTWICVFIQNTDHCIVRSFTVNIAMNGCASQPGKKHRNTTCSAPDCSVCMKYRHVCEGVTCQEVSCNASLCWIDIQIIVSYRKLRSLPGFEHEPNGTTCWEISQFLAAGRKIVICLWFLRLGFG